MKDLQAMLAIVLFVAVGVGLVVFHFSRSDALLRRWAEENGYRLLRQEYCWFFKGHFFWTSSRGQTVYYVVVEDPSGEVHRGWVRCGSWWFGLLSDKAEVRWED